MYKRSSWQTDICVRVRSAVSLTCVSMYFKTLSTAALSTGKQRPRHSSTAAWEDKFDWMFFLFICWRVFCCPEKLPWDKRWHSGIRSKAASCAKHFVQKITLHGNTFLTATTIDRLQRQLSLSERTRCHARGAAAPVWRNSRAAC